MSSDLLRAVRRCEPGAATARSGEEGGGEPVDPAAEDVEEEEEEDRGGGGGKVAGGSLRRASAGKGSRGRPGRAEVQVETTAASNLCTDAPDGAPPPPPREMQTCTSHRRVKTVSSDRRASLGRLKRSRARSGSVRMPAAHTQPGPASARESPHLAPRSARRSDAPSAHHLAPRSARRSGASNAAGPAVAAYGRKPAAHTQAYTQAGPASRREEALTSLCAPRVARMPPPLVTSLRAPRVARNARRHKRSALVAPCVGRWRAALAR